MNSDIKYLEDNIDNSTNQISGPWRMSKWVKENEPTSYVFSEEHGNEGTCSSGKEITKLIRDVLGNTDNVHVFIEHFIHADEIFNTDQSLEQACSIVSDNTILNNLRTCLEVMRIKRSERKDNIHFVDPRTDLIAILPGGNVYKSIQFYTQSLLEKDDKEAVLVTLFEAYIHPLNSLLPDQLVPSGRFSGSIEKAKNMMTSNQKTFFTMVWKKDVIGRILELTTEFKRMQKTLDVSTETVQNLYILYRDMTNKFLDTWLLAHIFLAQNKNMSASVVYLGSLHSLHFEKYLESYGYKKDYLVENKNLVSCISTKK